MKRMICLILAAALLLCGCAAKQQEAQEPTPMVSMYDLQKAMLAADSSLPEMKTVSSSDENASELFGYLSKESYDLVEGFFLAYAADGQSYEIAVVALKDAKDTPTMTDSLKAHVSDRVLLYKNYSPEQVTRAEKAQILSNGRYVALVMCDDQAAVKKAFEAGIQ